MKIGCCVSYDGIGGLANIRELGYDYVEAALNPMIKAPLEKIDAFAAALDENGITCPVVNCLFPGYLRLTGPDADFHGAEEYLDRILTNTAKLGYSKVVFGSGGPRRVLDGFPYEKAIEQLETLCSDIIEPAMANYNMVCCVEELNKLECNILNTCAETMAFVRRLKKSHIGFLLDFYHAEMEGETDFYGYRGEITHVHIASAKNKRAYPKLGDGEDYAAFFKCLRDIGYEEQSGMITIEGGDGGDFNGSSAESLKLLKSL